MGSTGGSQFPSSITKSGVSSEFSSSVAKLWAEKFLGIWSSVSSHSWVRGIVHILVIGQRTPWMIISPLESLISSESLVNLAFRLFSHNNPIEISDPLSSGKIWAIRAALGTSGQSSSPMWVDMMDFPFGK